MLCNEHNVFCTYNNKKNNDFIQLDISDHSNVKKIIEDIKPEIVINAAAFTDVDLSDLNRKIAWEVNSIGSFNLSDICQKNKIKLVTVTTDYIFSGLNSPYLESDIPNPIGFYGFSKLAGERVILNVCENSIVIRLPILYGYNDKNDKSTVVRDVIEKLSVGKKLK